MFRVRRYNLITPKLRDILRNRITFSIMEDVLVRGVTHLVKKFNVFLARSWKHSYDELTSTCELFVKN